MRLDTVAQASALSEVFRATLAAVRPASVALIGCAGGNGLEHIDRTITKRVVAVDLNPDYLAVCVRRFTFATPVAADIARPLEFAPVDLVHAALVLEFVAEPARALAHLRAVGAAVSLVLQVPSSKTAAVTPSPYSETLAGLAPIHRLVDPSQLGLRSSDGRVIPLPGGKSLWHAIIR